MRSNDFGRERSNGLTAGRILFIIIFVIIITIIIGAFYYYFYISYWPSNGRS